MPDGAGIESTTISTGIVVDGACVFSFSVDVPEADEYTFRIDGLPDLTQQRSLIDLRSQSGEIVLKPVLVWE